MGSPPLGSLSERCKAGEVPNYSFRPVLGAAIRHMLQLLRAVVGTRMRPTGHADQCPQLGVERTQRRHRLWAVHDPMYGPAVRCKRISSSWLPQAAAELVHTIPIVVPVLADPIALGFAASDARPGGNVTGISPYVKGLPAKQLELAREGALPTLIARHGEVAWTRYSGLALFPFCRLA
jgi:hypothetical protein